jgi:hypothetical protein
MTGQQPPGSSIPSPGWRSWIAPALLVLAVAYLVVNGVTGWTLIPVRTLYLSWAIGGAALSWWWLATGASAAAVALWILPYFLVLIAGLATLPARWAGVPSAAFYVVWTVVTLWDPARRLWQRANAWVTWPLFVAAIPVDQRDRYRRYRSAMTLSRIVLHGGDAQQKVSMLRATADRVRSLDAPSEPWLDARRTAAASCELWADMLEGRRPWDGEAVLDAFAQRDAAWEQVLYRLSPWGWRILMWGPLTRIPPGPRGI